jgi:hypothetical protein
LENTARTAKTGSKDFKVNNQAADEKKEPFGSFFF